MAKKRRTRAQKQRAAGRRQHVKVAPITEQVEAPVILETKSLEPLTPARPAQEKPLKLSGWSAYQRHSLRMSLLLLAALVGCQLLLWLLFHFTSIGSKLYELIKL